MTRSDVFTAEQRSQVMRAVKSRNTGPELKVRAIARELGFARRYRLNGAALPGKPDLVFPTLGKAIFVNGCFWHGHECARGARAPKHNAAYWRNKIARNRARDERALARLAELGWRALTIWECQARDAAQLTSALRAFLCEPMPPADRRKKPQAHRQRA